jgi:hypothetical protein
MMWAIGVFAVAAVVNQSAIAVFRRAQAGTELDVHQSRHPNCGPADDTGSTRADFRQRIPRY